MRQSNSALRSPMTGLPHPSRPAMPCAFSYPERLRAIASTFERQDRELGRSYALSELRQALNATSNDALRETQVLRGDG